MYKMFLKDAWSQTPSKIKYLNYSGWIWQLCYFGVILPAIIISSWRVNQLAYYYCFLVPMLGSLFLVRVWPNGISKTLLLCPLSATERKKYVYVGFQIRIFFSIVFFFLWNVPLYLLEKWKLWHFVIEFLFYLLYVITINIYVPPIKPSKNSYERKYNLPGYYNLWEQLAQINGMIGMVYFTDKFRMVSEIQNFGDRVGLGIFMSVELIIMIVMLVVYFKPVMEQAMQCDNRWREEKRSENYCKSDKSACNL